ncbi:MAG: hypothetical protein M3N39_11225 [Pseudomonadota bacterium]|nr:hypothetical protein [Pseudomonadota bacterium]
MANAGGAVGVQNRIANLEARYDAGLNAGVFTSAERSAISRQLTDLRRLERSYSSNGLTLTERRILQQRIRTLRDQLRAAGGPNWANRYGWSDHDLDDGYAVASGTGVEHDAYGRPVPNRTGTYDRYGRPVASKDVLYDRYGRPVATSDGVYDRYGRPVATGGGYGQGGPYEPVPRSSGVGNVLGGVLGGVARRSSGVGGVLGSVLGGGGGVGGILGSILSRGGLRTGDVITGAIGNVLGGAVGFGPQFRDTNNVYYRSDGQRVYEIDARTNTVMQVTPIQR